MSFQHNQTGASLGSLLITIVVIIVMALVAMKLVPPYIEAYQIESSVENVAKEANITKMTPLEMRDRIAKRFSINDIQSVSKSDIKIGREGYNYTVRVDYEVRLHFVHNIDLVLVFENYAEVKAF